MPGSPERFGRGESNRCSREQTLVRSLETRRIGATGLEEEAGKRGELAESGDLLLDERCRHPDMTFFPPFDAVLAEKPEQCARVLVLGSIARR